MNLTVPRRSSQLTREPILKLSTREASCFAILDEEETTLSFLTKVPLFLRHLKYLLPLTSPSFFPTKGLSNAIPTHSPLANLTVPKYRTVPVRLSSSATLSL